MHTCPIHTPAKTATPTSEKLDIMDVGRSVYPPSTFLKLATLPSSDAGRDPPAYRPTADPVAPALSMENVALAKPCVVVGQPPPTVAALAVRLGCEGSAANASAAWSRVCTAVEVLAMEAWEGWRLGVRASTDPLPDRVVAVILVAAVMAASAWI